MKFCTSCGQMLFTDSFSPQKSNPKKLYAYCDECRKQPYVKPMRNKGYAAEVKTMREKAKQLRAFDDPAALALFKEHEGGVEIKDLAVKHGKHPETIRKTLKRGRRLSM